MMWFTGSHSRRPHRACKACGTTAPYDAIRLKGGRFYCPRGACRRAAECLIQEARGRMEPASAAT